MPGASLESVYSAAAFFNPAGVHVRLTNRAKEPRRYALRPGAKGLTGLTSHFFFFSALVLTTSTPFSSALVFTTSRSRNDGVDGERADVEEDIAAPATGADEGRTRACLAAQPSFDQDGARRAGREVSVPVGEGAVSAPEDPEALVEEEPSAPPRKEASNACWSPALLVIPKPAMMPDRADTSKLGGHDLDSF